MPQFFIQEENINDNIIYINNSDDLKHLVNVLRLKPGDKLDLILENEFTFKVEVLDVSKSSIETTILKKEKAFRNLKTNITLAQSIIKSSKQDYLIQKSTEIGVNTIIPIISKNCVVKIKNEKDAIQKQQKWQKIADESCKQCYRSNIPVVENITDFKSLFNKASGYDVIIACVEANSEYSIKQVLQSNNYQNILLIIGPEGGWDKSEFELFKNNEVKMVTLGNLILRAETAAVNVLSYVVYENEI